MACLLGVGIAGVTKDSSGEHHTVTADGRLKEANPDDVENLNSESRNVRALKTELARKDLLIASLLAGKMKPAEADEHSDHKMSRNERLDATMLALDDRIAQRVPMSLADSQFRSDIQEVIEAGALVDADIVAMSCARDLCRLTLKSENAAALNSSVVSLSHSLGKIVGGLSVFNSFDGDKVVYLAQNSEDLVVDLPDAPVNDEPEMVSVDGDNEAIQAGGVDKQTASDDI